MVVPQIPFYVNPVTRKNTKIFKSNKIFISKVFEKKTFLNQIPNAIHLL
jgi:hypothetical protein